MSVSSRTTSAPTLGQALTPVVALMVMLAGSVALFGDESSSGPNQIALILGTAVATIVALRHGHTWAAIEAGISSGITTSMGAILILLVVGSVIGTWMLGGVVPSMIYYGLLILSQSERCSRAPQSAVARFAKRQLVFPRRQPLKSEVTFESAGGRFREPPALRWGAECGHHTLQRFTRRGGSDRAGDAPPRRSLSVLSGHRNRNG